MDCSCTHGKEGAFEKRLSSYAATIRLMAETYDFTNSASWEGRNGLAAAGICRMTALFPFVFNLYLPLINK